MTNPTIDPVTNRCTLPTFDSPYSYQHRYGYTYRLDDHEPSVATIQDHLLRVSAAHAEFLAQMVGVTDPHLSVRACTRYLNRLTRAETAVEAALPGISFETYGQVRAAFLAARSQVDEVLEAITTADLPLALPAPAPPSLTPAPVPRSGPVRVPRPLEGRIVTPRSVSARTAALPATQVGPAAEEAAYGSSLVVGLALGVLLLIALVGYLSRA